MKIKVTGQYKSLRDFESEKLPDFTVITGKNGSGKTQLLEAIKEFGSDNRNKTLTLDPQPSKIQAGGIDTLQLNIMSKDAWDNYCGNFLNEWTRIPLELKKVLSKANDFEYTLDDLFDTNKVENLYNEIKSELKFDTQNGRDISDGRRRKRIKNHEDLYRFFASDNSIKQFEKIFSFMVDLSSHFSKSLIEIKNADFFNAPIFDHYIDNNNLFFSSFSTICYVFAKNRDINNYSFFRKTEYKEKNNSISRIEFSNKNTPPWETFNLILSEINLDYELVGFTENEFSPSLPFGLTLIRKSTNEAIQADSLSSGEKVIFSLIMKLFTHEHYKDKLEYPDLIILDEPDAHLHPEMTQILINVLNDTFVSKLGIKVIITTHAPSTVALSPDESVYELRNSPYCSLKKLGKDKALEMLTEFIPNLSIDYKNHKQVFVEGPIDKYYYESIFSKMKNDRERFKQNNSRLYFISLKKEDGGSSVVCKIVSEIRNTGNKTFFGIIDRDQKNKSNESVIVHGGRNRYTLENYLLDPIYIAMLFLDNGGKHDMNKITGISKIDHFLLLKEYSNQKLQKIINEVLRALIEANKGKNFNTDLFEVEYLDGKKLNLPVWFLESTKEELLQYYKNAFDFLNSDMFKKYGQLQQVLTNIICQSYPMIPKDTVDLLTLISNGE